MEFKKSSFVLNQIFRGSSISCYFNIFFCFLKSETISSTLKERKLSMKNGGRASKVVLI